MVAIDNKIEQAMVSGITASFPSPDIAAAYVTEGRTEGVGAKAFRQEPEEADGLFPKLLEPLGRVPLERHLLGHLQSAVAGPPPVLLPLFAASSSLLGRAGSSDSCICLQPCIWQGPERSLDATHCRASAEPGLGSGVGRKQEAEHPTPSPSLNQVEVILHRAANMAAGAWGLQQLASTSLCPWCPATQFPAPGAVSRFREDAAVPAPSPRATSVLSGPRCPDPGVLGHLERRLQKSPFCSPGEDVYCKLCGVPSRPSLGGGGPATGPSVETGRADCQQAAEVAPRRLLSGQRWKLPEPCGGRPV